METKYEIKGATLIVYMPTEVDHHSAELINEYSDWFITGNNIENILFDFRNTEFMDSSGIGIVVGKYKLVKKLGGEIRIKNINNVVDRIFAASGVYKLIGVS